MCSSALRHGKFTCNTKSVQIPPEYTGGTPLQYTKKESPQQTERMQSRLEQAEEEGVRVHPSLGQTNVMENSRAELHERGEIQIHADILRAALETAQEMLR